MPETLNAGDERGFLLWSLGLSLRAVWNHADSRCSAIDSEWWEPSSWDECIFNRTKYWLLWKECILWIKFRVVDGDLILHPSVFYYTLHRGDCWSRSQLFWDERGVVTSQTSQFITNHPSHLNSHLPQFRKSAVCDVRDTDTPLQARGLRGVRRGNLGVS